MRVEGTLLFVHPPETPERTKQQMGLRRPHGSTEHDAFCAFCRLSGRAVEMLQDERQQEWSMVSAIQGSSIAPISSPASEGQTQRIAEHRASLSCASLKFSWRVPLCGLFSYPVAPFVLPIPAM